TAGRYDSAGVVPRNARRDTIGWLTRTVADVELLDAFSGRRAPDARPVALESLRLGVPRAYFYESLDPGVARIVERALDLLRAAGVTLIEADIPRLDELRRAASAGDGWAAFLRDLDRYLVGSGSGVSVEELVRSVADPQLRRSMT